MILRKEGNRTATARMEVGLQLWDVALLVIVSLQVTAMAYLQHPRWKALALALPFPFTTIALGQGQPINVTHVLAAARADRILPRHSPLPPSLAYRAIYRFGIGPLRAQQPHAPQHCAHPTRFVSNLRWDNWPAGTGLFLWQPPRSEPHHRTPLPVYLKLPTVIAVVGLLVYLKSTLQGFATLFPLVGVVGLYEARKGLWSVCRQAPVFALGMCALLTATYITQPLLGFTRCASHWLGDVSDRHAAANAAHVAARRR